MKQKIESRRIDLSTEAQVDKIILKLSEQYPEKYIVAYGRLGKLDVWAYDRSPTTDCAASIQTYRHFGGFLKNRRVVKPTARWMKRYNHKPALR